MIVAPLSILCAEGVDHLELDARFCHGSERVRLPVDLFHLLPHHHVETGAVLVAEDEACVVVVCYRVHMERAFKVHTAESCVSCEEDTGVRRFLVFFFRSLRIPLLKQKFNVLLI